MLTLKKKVKSENHNSGSKGCAKRKMAIAQISFYVRVLLSKLIAISCFILISIANPTINLHYFCNFVMIPSHGLIKHCDFQGTVTPVEKNFNSGLTFKLR